MDIEQRLIYHLSFIIYHFTSFIMINKDFVYAVIGASNNQDKYGYKVFKDLVEWWYHTVPINPNEKKILGKAVSPTLSDYKWKIDVVIFVVPPHVTEKVLEEVKTLGIKRVRIQPGAESQHAIIFCEKNGIACVHDACIMIQRKLK